MEAKYNWNLKEIFENREEFDKTKKELEDDLNKINNYQGKLCDSSDNLYNCYKLYEKALEKYERLYGYGMLYYNLDMSNQEGIKLYKEVESIGTNFSTKVSFMTPEITYSKNGVVEKYLANDKRLERYKRDIEDILKEKEHILSKKEETLLANYSEIFSAPENTFDILTNAEFKFGNLTNENGEEVELTESNYTIFLKSQKEDVRKQAFNLMYDLNIPSKDKESFLSAIKTSSVIPFTTFMEMLLMINYVLNDEKRSIGDFISIDNIPAIVPQDQTANVKISQEYHYNSLSMEKEIIKIVKSGDTILLDNLVKNMKPVRSGFLSKNPLKQEKILFICTITLVSRAAIEAGVDPEHALTLSDNYIQKCQLLNKEEDVRNLYYESIREYTTLVSYLKNNDGSSIANKVTNYLLQNLSKRISLQEIADYFYVSKTYLCKIFKKETGITLNNFLLKKKIEISKLLLQDEDKTILFISDYLGFSSQPHFTKTFLEFEKITPKEYREKIKKASKENLLK